MLSKNPYYLKSGLYSILEKILTLLFSIGSVFILYRHISVEEAGIWVQFLVVTGLLELARNGLVQNGLIKFLSTSEKENYPRILSSSLILSLTLSLIIVLFLATSGGWLSSIWRAPELELMFKFHIVTTFILVIYNHFNFIEQANLSFKGNFFGNLTRQGVFFFLILSSRIFDYQLELIKLVEFQIVAASLGTITSYFFVRKYLRFYRDFDYQWIKNLFNFGKFTFGSSINNVIFTSIDQMMLGSLVGNSAAGFYNVAIRVSNIVDIPTSSVAVVIFPQSAIRMKANGLDALKSLYEKSVGLIIALIVPASIIIYLLPHIPIQMVAGKKFLEAVPILQVTIFYTLIAPFTRQFGTIIDSTGNTKLTFFFTLSGAVINIILNYLFIKTYGITGAAFATLVTYLLLFVCSQVILYRIFKVNTFNVFYYSATYYYKFFTFSVNYLRNLLKKGLSFKSN